MKSIIQISDFHIKSIMAKPKDNPVLTGFVEFIKSLEIEKPILVYNGDVIDSRFITEKIPTGLSEKDKESMWDQEAEKAFSLAEEYFHYIMRELEIPNDRVIICCGNHDVNRFCSEEKSIKCIIEGSKEISYGTRRFTKIGKFIDRIVLKKGTCETHVRKIEGINFIVANSQWRDKCKDRLCINCDSLSEILDKNYDALEKTKAIMGKQHNIFIAHSPRTDYCEYALYKYKDNAYTSVMEQIDLLCGLELFGDKHTDSVHNYDYIVGAPLDEKHITYGLHQFNDSNQYNHKTLTYQNGTWSVNGSLSNIEEILKISAPSIKMKALYYLFKTTDLYGLHEKIINFETARSSASWRELDKLFRSYISIQKPQSGRAGIPISLADGVINTLTRLVDESKTRVSAALRGRVRTGKSVFMTIYYLNLLYRFHSGTFTYMPLYINVEEIEKSILAANNEGKDSRDNREFQDKVISKIKGILDDGIKLAEKNNSRACCLIDGLCQHVFYDNVRIEQEIKKLLGANCYTLYAHLIYCIDTDNDLSFEYTPMHTDKNAEYVVYFRQVTTNNVNSPEKYDDFIDSFCALSENATLEEINQVKENIDRLQFQEIDLNTLIALKGSLTNNNSQTLFNLVDEYTENQLDGADIFTAPKISYLLYIKNKNFTEIRNMSHNASDATFELIRTQKIIANYLIAVNYVLSIKNLSKGETIDKDSPLNHLYGNEICSYIREYIFKNNLQKTVQEFERDRYNQLTYAGKSTLTYLIGRISSDSKQLQEVLDKEEKYLMINSLEDIPYEQDVLEFYIAKRSLYISRISGFIQHSENTKKYIRMLLSDDIERKVNRDFYLQFYGDRKYCDINLNKDVILEGFDIYKTYHLLASRLKSWLATKKSYPLLSIEIFTLCDLLQVRVDNPCVTVKKNEEDVDSFLYNQKYNLPKSYLTINVLAFIIQVIEAYSDIYANQEGMYLFYQYLRQQKAIFTRIKEQLNTDKFNKPSYGFEPAKLLPELSILGKIKKIGWNITDKIKTLSYEDYQEIIKSSELHETTLQHVYESYLIGLLYLPSTSIKNTKYNKQKILNMILIHDIGEAYIGDYPPSYEKYHETKEDEDMQCEKLFLSGTHDGVADMIDYLILWNEWSGKLPDDCNIRIAKEIDKIQMLHKLLTMLVCKEVIFTRDRIFDFWKSVESIRSDEGKAIYNRIIALNQTFVDIAGDYGITISPLI